ncbi:cytochrome c oxidase assembly factor CtaG [Bacillus litorisediminis]|uniref:cytochrome c oxidase assembly factor CtaG n=1 Tax=Bacillus litorisediminis TaxID=2922713 RepID=UPI001FAE584F|nr:cytochrome c oxidase assembly factor CtaG [Bacillus litorisediminis]
MSIFNTFSFVTLWSPYFFLFLMVITCLYFYMIRNFQKKWSKTEPLKTKDNVYFISGMALIYITMGSPLDVMSHIVFSAHMIQMAVLFLIAPILIIRGVPSWAWRKLLIENKIVAPVFRLFTKPIVALILFNGIFSFYHVPLIFDRVKTDFLIHGIYMVVLFILAFCMWWPLMNKVEEKRSLSGLRKIGYLLAASVLLTPACALIIFAEEPLYLTYTNPTYWAEAMKLCLPIGISIADLGITGPEMFNTMPLRDDQQLGGVLMKIIQEIVYGIVLASIFFSWYRQEQEAEKEEQEKAKLKPNYAE